jgi:hypothetical protein
MGKKEQVKAILKVSKICTYAMVSWREALTVYGLAFAEKELDDIEQAQMHFLTVQELVASEALRGLARNGLLEIAAREFWAKGGRGWMLFYPTGHCGYSRGVSQEVSRR